jgi:hypothetical protein
MLDNIVKVLTIKDKKMTKSLSRLANEQPFAHFCFLNCPLLIAFCPKL